MRRPDLPVLTSLRFPAAAAIVLLHALPLLGWSDTQCEALVSGVSFFYVLSGFILYYNYAELTDRASFWLARFARIWPLHAVTLGLALLLIPFNWLLGHEHWYVTLPANVLLVQAWLPFHGSALSYNGVAWSLSVEMAFYLLFPWLLLAMQKRGAGPVLVGSFALGLVIVMAAARWYPAEPYLYSFFPLCRVFEFVLGMSACQWWFAHARTPGGRAGWSVYEIMTLAAVALLALAIRPFLRETALTHEVIGWMATAISAMAFTALIWVYAHQAGMISRFFSARFFVHLGEISFALYMCHQVLLNWLGTEPFGWKVNWTPMSLSIYVAACLALSWLLFAVVENPARRFILRRYGHSRAGH